MKHKILATFLIVTVLTGSVVLAGCNNTQTEAPPPEDVQQEQQEQQQTPGTTTTPPPPAFQQQIFQNIIAAHYVSSDPVNNALLTAAPSGVVISFNFTLGTQSTITVTRDGVVVNAGPTNFAPDLLAMGVPINANQTGNYKVDYVAYWPDGSYHVGSFGFSVLLP